MDSRERDRERNVRKERALERILPGALAEEGAAGPCPDAEILAAFYERSLEPAEVSHWRAHFSTCRRCQLSLAALAASDPRPLAEKEVERLGQLVADATAPRAAGDLPLRAKPRKIKWPWFLDPRALAPMAAAAAFIAALGITIRTQRVGSLLELQKGNSTQPVIVAEKFGEPAAPELQTPAPAPEKFRAPASSENKKASQSQGVAPSASVPQHAAGVTAQREEIRAKSGTPSATPAAAQAQAPPPPEPVPGGVTESVTVESRAAPTEDSGSVGGSAAAPPASAPAEDRASSANAPASGASAPAAEASAPVEGRAASSHVRREDGVVFDKNSESQLGATTEAVEVKQAPGYFSATSPDGKTQWRFGRRGLIERTTNADAAVADQSWALQKSPLRADLLAGSAPSATVCWIVGRAGAILRTTDGAAWRKIPSPASAARDGAAPDWVAVAARDANSATITSADGRVFVTTDAGQTWQPQ